jgi:hypothetical protein
MDDIEYNDLIKQHQKKDEANRFLESAALSGDLNRFTYLINCDDYKGIIDPACGGNYPLKAASLRGHIPIIEFLINYPDKEKRKQIIAFENIRAGIDAAIEHGQDEVYLYFKNKCTKAYKNYMKKGPHNSILDVATMRGYLSTIKLVAADVKDKSEWKYNLFIEKSVQYNHPECFEYFLKYFDKKKFNEEKNLINIAHVALYHERFEFLDKIIKNSELNLNEHLTVNHFQILLEVKFDSLKHIVMKYDYRPNEELMYQINSYLDRKEDNKFTKDLNKFLNLLEKHNLQKEISNELAENPSSPSFKKKKI